MNNENGGLNILSIKDFSSSNIFREYTSSLTSVACREWVSIRLGLEIILHIHVCFQVGGYQEGEDLDMEKGYNVLLISILYSN